MEPKAQATPSQTTQNMGVSCAVKPKKKPFILGFPYCETSPKSKSHKKGRLSEPPVIREPSCQGAQLLTVAAPDLLVGRPGAAPPYQLHRAGDVSARAQLLASGWFPPL